MATPQFTPEQLEQMARAQAKITAEQEKQKVLAEDLVDAYDAIEKELDGISKLITNQLKNQGASARQVSEIKSIYNSLNRTNRELQYLNDKYYEGTLRTKDITSQINTLSRTETNIRRQINLALDKGDKALAAKFQKELRILDKQRAQAETLKEQNEYVDKRVGLTGKLLGGLEKIPILGDAIDFEEINTSMRNAVGNTNVFGAGLKKALGQLKEGLKDPLVQFGLMAAFYGKLISMSYRYNQSIVDLQRQLNLSYEEAENLYKSTLGYSNTTKESLVTAAKLVEAQTKLNELLGTSVNFGNKNAEAFVKLTTFYKVSEDTVAKLTQLSTEQNTNTSDLYKNTLRTYTVQRAQLGGTMAFNKLLDKVANISDDIYVNFKGNPEAIAKAVMEADRLGLTLEQVNKIGESLLNFESSIESELKAELLTGKQINLEKARQYALSGDTANLTKEIAKQVGNIHQFEKMNVIQRQAYAEAMGMSVQEMSAMLRKQEFEAKLSEEAKKSAQAKLDFAAKNGITLDEALKKQYEQESLAERQKRVFEKLDETLQKILSGPMGKFIDMLNGALGLVESILKSFNQFTGGVLGDALGAAIVGAPLLIGAAKLMSGGLKGLLFARGTVANPMITQDVGSAADGGLTDMLTDFGGGGKGRMGKFLGKGGFGRGKNLTLGKSLMKGAKGFGWGAAIGIGADLVADQMDEGTGKDVVSGVGTAASWAGTGALIGSIIPGVGTAIGAGVGAIAGSIKALFDAEANRREREEKEKQAKEEATKRTNELLQQFIDRPIQLNVGGKTILDFNTASNLYGTQRSSFS